MRERYKPSKPSRAKRKLLRFLRRYRNLLLIGAAAAAALVVIFVVVPAAQKAGEPAPVETGDTELATDPETLAGLTGEGAVFDQEGEFSHDTVKIGVTLQELAKDDYAFLSGMEKAAAADREQGAIESFEVRDARGDRNQQIQDVYTMINDGVSVLIVAETDAYNFGKIAEICRAEGVAVVAYNIDAKSGFAVNIQSTADAAADFAGFIKSSGVSSTDVLKGTPEQVEQVRGILAVDERYPDMWDAVASVQQSIADGAPKESIIVFDYNGSDVLRSWLRKEQTPKAMAGVATVNYIKTWYQLLNGGVSVELSPGEEDSETITVSATPAQFKGCAVTAVENAGDIVYAFAIGLAKGGALPEENMVYEVGGYEIITNDNLAQFYEQVKDQEGGLVYSRAEMGDIEALFTPAAQTGAAARPLSEE